MMQNNIYFALDLFLDPAITDTVKLREDLESKIKVWNNKGDRFKGEVAKAREFITAGLSNLQQQANEARENRLSELKRQVNLAKKSGVVEEQTKNIINRFGKYFSEATILGELGIQTQETGFPPKQPDSLVQNCKKPVSYGDMSKIAKDLEYVGKKSLYELLGLSQNTGLSKL